VLFGRPNRRRRKAEDRSKPGLHWLGRTSDHPQKATIWVAPQSGDTFGQSFPVSELNAQGSVGFPVPSDDGTYIYFRSTHDDAGLAHIWIAKRDFAGRPLR
jgi:hypothetical protein